MGFQSVISLSASGNFSPGLVRLFNRLNLNLRSVLVDTVLIGTAIAYLSDAVQQWFMAHREALGAVLIALHVSMLPLLTLAQLMPGVPGASRLTNPGQATPLSQVFVWLYVLHLGAGLIVPGVINLGVSNPGPVAFGASIIGPLICTALAFFILTAIDERFDHRYSRLDAAEPTGFTRSFAVIAWAYLLAMETLLLTAVTHPRSHSVLTARPAVLMAAIVGYLPVRLAIALIHRSRWSELLLSSVGFVHLLYRLATTSAPG